MDHSCRFNMDMKLYTYIKKPKIHTYFTFVFFYFVRFCIKREKKQSERQTQA